MNAIEKILFKYRKKFTLLGVVFFLLFLCLILIAFLAADAGYASVAQPFASGFVAITMFAIFAIRIRKSIQQKTQTWIFFTLLLLILATTGILLLMESKNPTDSIYEHLFNVL
mgnify:CR=1 FL=1|tara:strand:+ start:1055 stop:1393 length:339 start_codon:yes stop_codon:yes gene_type:complete